MTFTGAQLEVKGREEGEKEGERKGGDSRLPPGSRIPFGPPTAPRKMARFLAASHGCRGGEE